MRARDFVCAVSENFPFPRYARLQPISTKAGVAQTENPTEKHIMVTLGVFNAKIPDHLKFETGENLINFSL